MEITTEQEWEALLKKADNDDVAAQIEVALIYEQGLIVNHIEIVKVDKPSALLWTKRAYHNGDLEAMIKYAHYLTSRDNAYGELNIELGMELYQKAIGRGSNYAAYSLGLEYRSKGNYHKAFELYNQSQREDDYYKEITIGMCYYYGIGVAKDKLKALEVFQSIDKHNVSAYEVDEVNYMIGKIYLEGDVVEKDIVKARCFLELADSDGDHRSAQEILFVIGRTKLMN